MHLILIKTLGSGDIYSRKNFLLDWLFFDSNCKFYWSK